MSLIQRSSCLIHISTGSFNHLVNIPIMTKMCQQFWGIKLPPRNQTQYSAPTLAYIHRYLSQMIFSQFKSESWQIYCLSFVILVWPLMRPDLILSFKCPQLLSSTKKYLDSPKYRHHYCHYFTPSLHTYTQPFQCWGSVYLHDSISFLLHLQSVLYPSIKTILPKWKFAGYKYTTCLKRLNDNVGNGERILSSPIHV
jgi:hypothetical protein